METVKFTEAIWSHVSVKQRALARAFNTNIERNLCVEPTFKLQLQSIRSGTPLDVNAWAGVD
jgi:hypothetical protein